MPEQSWYWTEKGHCRCKHEEQNIKLILLASLGKLLSIFDDAFFFTCSAHNYGVKQGIPFHLCGFGGTVVCTKFRALCQSNRLQLCRTDTCLNLLAKLCSVILITLMLATDHKGNRIQSCLLALYLWLKTTSNWITESLVERLEPPTVWRRCF